ncbi:nitroreductase family protein [Sporolactobacillus pectinivorans]|uniref:nitroreductase family protein n=1 Tax=Sporolactobacillus pectinivorans TaxID=1591408 RepID=UPI00138FE894|nr:nitroreductase family protein [Sporolactobacillus pectinivorans]
MKKDVENELAPEILQRKSVSHWNGEKCSEEIWDLLIEAARLAPSSWNHQPARYIIIKDEKNIRALSQCLHRTNQWVSDASGLIVQVAKQEDDDRTDGKDYYLYDCGLAMMSLIYQAQIMGLMCRQMIGWDERQVKQRLDIPEPYRVVVITALGFPSKSGFRSTVQDLKRNLTQQNRRYKVNQVFFREKWNGKTNHESHCEYAPSFLLSPSTRKKVQHVRFYTDIIGLLVIYTLVNSFRYPFNGSYLFIQYSLGLRF